MSEKDKESSSSTPGETEQTTDSRGQYYDKWNKFTTEQLDELDAEAEKEKLENDAAVGLNKAFNSEAEKLDAEKDVELRKEKEAWDKKKEQMENTKQFIDDEAGVDRRSQKMISKSQSSFSTDPRTLAMSSQQRSERRSSRYSWKAVKIALLFSTSSFLHSIWKLHTVKTVRLRCRSPSLPRRLT